MLLQIQSRYGSYPIPTYINTEHVVRVSPHMNGAGETFIRIWMLSDNMETVTIEEWQRIAPLLTNAQSTKPASVLPPDVIAAWRKAWNDDADWQTAYFTLWNAIEPHIPADSKDAS